jgi:hypothetical protein
MSNQRVGKTHQAGARDSEGGTVSVKNLIAFLKDCERALASDGESDAELRFELFREWVETEVAYGAPFKFSHKILGL